MPLTSRLYQVIQLLLTVAIMSCCGSMSGAGKSDPVPGSVQFKYGDGLILRGRCSLENQLGPDPGGKHLELRLIDQGFRHVYIAQAMSDRIVEDATAWPVVSYEIPRQREDIKPLPASIGFASAGPFSDDGTATIRLTTIRNEPVEVRVAIVSVNEQFAEVRGLTHRLEYTIPVSSIPGRVLSGVLQRVPEFQNNAFLRLNLAQILMKAERFDLAQEFLETILAPEIQQKFPNIAARYPELRKELRAQLGRQVLSELQLLTRSGQHRLASEAARLFPQNDVPPEILLQVRELTETADSGRKRLDELKARLDHLSSKIEDASVRQHCEEMLTELKQSVDLNNVDDFGPFELLSDAENEDPESGIALAVSGWLLGADEAIRSFAETKGLFEIRQFLRDALRTADDESAVRAELVQKVKDQEGFSMERLSQLIARMPPLDPLTPEKNVQTRESRFQVSSTELMAGCSGIFPPEYSESRRYPMVIAFPREFVSAEKMTAWWAAEAARNGFIVVVPEIYDAAAETYDASANTHVRFLNLMRRLRFGLSVDDDRVFIAGHGIGGEAAMDIAASHPELFAGVISVGGLGRRHLQWTARNDPKLPWYIVVGERQTNWFDRLSVQLTRLFLRDQETKSFPSAIFVKYPSRGHEVFREEAPLIFRWMQMGRRAEPPEKMNLRILRSTDTDWNWIQLHRIPQRFCQLDKATVWNDGPFEAATTEAELTSGNVVRIRSQAAGVTLKLSPDLPKIRLEEKLAVICGNDRQSITYRPAPLDMIEELRRTGDRTRLCWMKVTIRP
jgi:pimeloyl-ACP methyl ester carboxylesterase